MILEKKHSRNFPDGTIFGDSTKELEGEGFFIVMIGRRADSLRRFAKVFGHNMAIDEVVERFLLAMEQISDKRGRDIGIA